MKNESNDQELVRKLLRGSANIDRMRREISQLLGMISGLMLQQDIYWKNPQSMNLVFSDGRWEVDLSISPREVNSQREVNIRCIKYVNDLRITVLSNTIEKFGLDTEDVKFVHNNLSSLIGGLRVTFPSIEQMWQPLIDAADASPE